MLLLHSNRPPFFASACLLAALSISMGCSALPGSSFDVTPPVEEELPLLDRLAPVDGTIIHALETGITKGWGDLSPTGRARFSEDQWNAAIESVERHAELLTYSSDGLRVGALLVRPASTEGRQLGAVIVNRDGLAGRGLDKDLILGDLALYANEGFVAVSSAYRGNQLSQGVDELGGDDVNDVLSLVTLVQRLDYVDPDRIFMVGFGRGGMMTYRALEMDAPIRAAAVISGASDMAEVEAINPEISSGFSDSGGWDGLEKIYGGWDATKKTRELERRSPRGRAGNDETPLLIVHGRLDERVPVSQAMDVASRWNESEIPVESVIYGYGNHDLVEQQADWRGRVMDWIKRHDARSLLN